MGLRPGVKILRMLRLGVLDQSPIRTGATSAAAIRETVALAEACDRWGYHRYELVIVTITEDPASRLRSYELLAQAFADSR